MKKEEYDDDFYIRLMYGMQLYRTNHFDDAIKFFLAILSEYPNSIETHYNIAIVYMRCNKYEDALQHLFPIIKTLNTEPDHFQGDVLSLIGVCHIQLNSLSNAIDAFQKAAQINPSLRFKEIAYLKNYIQGTSEIHQELYHELGNCYYDIGNDFHAEDMYMKVLEYGGNQNQTSIIEKLTKLYERIHRMKPRIITNYSNNYSPTEYLLDNSITWVISVSFPLEDSDEIIYKRRKHWEPYFVNGNRILELQWCDTKQPDTNLAKPIYDGILLLIREKSLSSFQLLRMLKYCFKWINPTGKIIIMIENSDHTSLPYSSIKIVETILNSAGWTIKETNKKEDIHSYSIVAQKTSYEIFWQSPVFMSSGYTESQNHFLDSLRPYPLRIKVYPIDSVPPLDLYPPDMKSHLLSLQNQDIQSPIIHYQAMPAAYFSHPVAPISIGRTMFETNSLPSSWVEILNEMTEIWVPSEFNRETFASAGVKSDHIYVLPEPIDEDKYNPLHALPYPLKENRSFKFLSVFDWSIRKGWEILLQAYFEEFSEEDDVSLILKVSKINEPNTNPYTKIKDLTQKLGLKKLPHVHIIQDTLSHNEMVGLYAAVDCFVLPSRGEGWGRPYMEAMAMKLPTIGTRWSGQQAFMNDENSYLINIEGLIPVDPTGMPPHFHGHKWAEPSIDHLKYLMRYVYHHPAEAKLKGLKARNDLFPRFSRHTIGKQIYERMNELVNYYYQ